MGIPDVTPYAPVSHGRTAFSQFEVLYRGNLTAISAYFARRSTDPQTVADLTSETFTRALTSIDRYAGRGSFRAWLIAIAHVVYVDHCAGVASNQAAAERVGGEMQLAGEDVDDLVDRIDAQRASRELLARIRDLPELERGAIELVDIAGMSPRNAARALEISPGTLRVRLHRARARLRKEGRHS